jgi:penicillin amidase
MGTFSFAWTGQLPGESMMTTLPALIKSKNLYELKERIVNHKEWRSAPLNLVFADREGNIGYFLASTPPKRGNDYPYLGCRVLDGTIKQHDWLEDPVPIEDLPLILNPEKGWFMTANNRVVPENSRLHAGATTVSTARANRLIELIEAKTKSNKKFSAQDMVDMQQDVTDVFCRDTLVKIIEITE